MKRNVVLALAAGALALGVSFSAPQAAMPILDAPQGVDAGTLVTPVQSIRRCRAQLAVCRRECLKFKNPNARQNCYNRCVREYQRCIRP